MVSPNIHKKVKCILVRAVRINVLLNVQIYGIRFFFFFLLKILDLKLSTMQIRADRGS
mgnify:CR=1 FL=1